MQVTKDFSGRDSVQELQQALRVFANAAGSVIHIRTREIIRCVMAVREAALISDCSVKEWDIVHGFRDFTLTNADQLGLAGDQNVDLSSAFGSALDQHFKALDTDTTSASVSVDASGLHEPDFRYFVYVNPQDQMENNPMVTHILDEMCHILPAGGVRVVLITPDQALPGEYADNIMTATFNPPGLRELREGLDAILEDVYEAYESHVDPLPDEDRDAICYSAAGMSKDAFQAWISTSMVRGTSDGSTATLGDIRTGIADGKTEIVKKNDLLELYTPEQMSNVGGMENLKSWVDQRVNCFSDEAAAFGIEPPKGVVVVGPPGTGKSLVAKAIASRFGVPLIRLDFGRVFNSLVGSSEQRIRTALAMVETMAPCILFVDEVDKGLGGIGSGGDAGTSSRVLGTFLTWLNDSTSPVFTVVTANNITGLPPELLRRGRFDNIFATGLPNPDERAEVVKIHLAKRGWDMDDQSVRVIANVCKGYVPAEIESGIKDALISAFSKGEEELTVERVIASLKEIVPLSVSHKEAILAITVWATQNAVPASRAYDDPAAIGGNVSRIAKSTNRPRVRVKPNKPEGPTKH